MDQKPFPFVPLGDEDGLYAHQSVALGAAVFNVYIPKDANVILIQALTQNVRYTLQGTLPTASKGFRLTAGDAPVMIALNDHISINCIVETAGAYIEYEFGRNPIDRAG